MGYWRDRLNKYLDTFEKKSRADWTEDMKPTRISDTGGKTVSFTLYRVPGKAPRDFFRRFLIRGESSTRKRRMTKNPPIHWLVSLRDKAVSAFGFSIRIPVQESARLRPRR